MGQKAEVITFRYMMQNSVEEVNQFINFLRHSIADSVQNVVNLQKRKSGLAKFTLGSESEDNISNTLQVSNCAHV